MAFLLVIGTCILGAAIAALFYALLRLRFIAKDEQLYIEDVTELTVVNGPKIHLMPFILKSSVLKKAVSLTDSQYCVIKNTLTGESRIEQGPQLLFLKAYDKVIKTDDMFSLMKNEFIRFLDGVTGKIRVERGEKGKVVPSPTEQIYKNEGKRIASELKSYEYAEIQNSQTGDIRIEVGPSLAFLDAFEELLSVNEAYSLMKNEYMRFKDKVTGKIRVERGEQGRVIPSPTEEIFNGEGKRTATELKASQYAMVENSQTGQLKMHAGPSLVFLNAFEELMVVKNAYSLMKNEYIRFFDQETGKMRVERGEQGQVIPGPMEEPYDGDKLTAIDLKLGEYTKIQNTQTNEIRLEAGPKLVFLDAYESFINNVEKYKCMDLKKNEYIKINNGSTGEVRVERGPKLVTPGPYDFMQKRMQAIDLKCYEYVKIMNKETGQLRTVRGEKLFFPEPFDEIVGGYNCVQEAIEVDEETAVLVRNKRSGQQFLVTEQQLFVPADDEELIEVRKLIKLADYEVCFVRGKDGKHKTYYGTNDEQRSFFLPPYSELVKLCWSRGRRRETRDLYTVDIQKLDMRPIYMSFEFNCRTSDNVELVLEGSFFWEVQNPEEMLKFTGDTTGDICNHARSQFIERVSKVTLQDFMGSFNQIALAVHKEDTTFYSQRGVLIHSLEVTGYHCAEKATARVLQEIIQESTNRLNRLQMQASENEVELFKIKGDIEEEKARSSLLEIQTDNSNARSAMEGLGEAEKVKRFLKELEDDIPDMAQRIELWQVLRQREALHEVSAGNASLFYTPEDVNLTIRADNRK